MYADRDQASRRVRGRRGSLRGVYSHQDAPTSVLFQLTPFREAPIIRHVGLLSATHLPSVPSDLPEIDLGSEEDAQKRTAIYLLMSMAPRPKKTYAGSVGCFSKERTTNLPASTSTTIRGARNPAVLRPRLPEARLLLEGEDPEDNWRSPEPRSIRRAVPVLHPAVPQYRERAGGSHSPGGN